MIDLNDIVRELKSKVFLYTDLLSKQRDIENINIVGNDVFLTITNHNLQSTEDAITIKDIKYKYAIEGILKLPAVFGVNRFLMKVADATTNPLVEELRTVEIKDVITDTQYNGIFTIEQMVSPTEFVLQTTNAITATSINNQGNILYAHSDSKEMMNTLNGYKQITIIDNNTLKYSLNEVGNKSTPVLNSIDFIDAKVGLTQQIHLIDDSIYADSVIGTLDEDLYTLLVIFISDTGSTQNGISIASPDVTNTATGGTIVKRDLLFNVEIYSKKLQNVNNDYIKLQSEFYTEIAKIKYAVWQSLNRATFNIPFASNDSSTFPAIMADILPNASQKNFKSEVISFKISYQIVPSDIIAIPVTTRIKKVDFNNTIDKQNYIYGKYEE